MTEKTPEPVDIRLNSGGDDEVTQLVLRGLQGSLDPAEQARLDALAASDPLIMQQVARLTEAWSLAGIAARPDRAAQSLLMSRRGFAAAGLAGLAASAVFGWRHFAAEREYAAPGDAVLRASLEDGTTVVLSPGGRFRARMDGKHRAIEMLGGEALWTVAADPERPFRIRVAGHRLSVLGTRFNVEPASSGLRVDLLEGSLRVESERDAPVVLVPGQRYWANHDPKVVTADVASQAAWVDGRLIFENATLAEVATRVQLHTGRHIAFEGASLADLHFSGILSVGDMQSWGPGLEAVLPVRVVPTKEGFRVSAKS